MTKLQKISQCDSRVGYPPSIYAVIAVILLSAAALSAAPLAEAAEPAPPQVVETRASFADETSAIVEAVIVPGSVATTYVIKGGLSAAGATVAEGSLASADTRTTVRTRVTGLQPGSTYHYDVEVTSAAGQANSREQILETLNSCGLPEGRCLELVSPADPGPNAQPGSNQVASQTPLFVAAARPGALAYGSEGGFPGATSGGPLSYLATRGSTGWQSLLQSPPVNSQSQLLRGAEPSFISFISGELTCSIVSSNQILTPDPGTDLARESGSSNLYVRDNLTNSYTAITSLPPLNPAEGQLSPNSAYRLIGTTEDCSKVVFEAPFRYPGVPAAAGANGIYETYEWQGGSIRALGHVPGESGEVLTRTEEFTGRGGAKAGRVSASGDEVFFGAVRQSGRNPGEVGTPGVFVREGGVRTRDVSLSETTTPDEGAYFESASADGSRVFFTANAGLTEVSSSEGTDLYEYSFDVGPGEPHLTDLSIGDREGVADVQGFVGASTDGSSVYFTALGQLVPGVGKTLEENRTDGTVSIFKVQGGRLAFVSEVVASEATRYLYPFTFQYSSRVSADGRYLLFESQVPQSGYPSFEAAEAYLYDSGAGQKGLTCLSCRQDGSPPFSVTNGLAAYPGSTGSPFAPIAFQGSSELDPKTLLVIRNGQPVVFFRSYDRLADGASEGNFNVYEWTHGQIFTVTGEPVGQSGVEMEPHVAYGTANSDGTDVYFTSTVGLLPEAEKYRVAVYDARVGGGFARQQAAPGCSALVDGSCEMPPTGSEGSPTIGSGNLVGAGNVRPRRPQSCRRKKKGHQKAKCRPRSHKRSHRGNHRSHRNTNRRTPA